MDLKQEAVRENAAVGTLGALLGAPAGLACIVPVGRLDIIAAVSGLSIGIFAVKGYEKLAGALGKGGAVISCVVILFTTYPAHHLNVTIRVTEELGMSFPDAFLSVPKLLQLDILNGFDFFICTCLRPGAGHCGRGCGRGCGRFFLQFAPILCMIEVYIQNGGSLRRQRPQPAACARHFAAQRTLPVQHGKFGRAGHTKYTERTG